MASKNDIFISYSRKDFGKVKPIVDILKNNGVKVWFDMTGIESGEEFIDKIVDAIDNSDVVLFFCTEASLQSPWTQKEVMYANKLQKRVVPILFNSDVPLRGWFGFLYSNIDCIDYSDRRQREKFFSQFSIVLDKKRNDASTKAGNKVVANKDVVLYSYYENGKYGFKGSDGIIHIPCKYSHVEEFYEDRALVGDESNEKCGFIDRDGKLVIDYKYDCAGRFSEGIVNVELNGKWGLIDKNGNWVLHCQYDNIHLPFHDSMASVFDYTKGTGFIDTTGKLVIPFSRERFYLHDFSEGLIVFGDSNSEKYGYMDKTGKIVINPIYDDAKPFHGGLATVCLNDKYAVIRKNGEIAIPYSTAEISPFVDGYAQIYCDGKYGIINEQGMMITNLIYDDMPEVDYDDIDTLGIMSEGMMPVKKDGKWGVFDILQRKEIVCQFDGVQLFSEGLAAVCRKDKWGYINKNGEYVIPPSYIRAYPFIKGIAMVKKKRDKFFIDRIGERLDK